MVWNAYNQIDRQLYYLPSANSWTYTTATLRQANNTAANKVEAVSGLEGSAITVDNWVMCSNGAAAVNTYMAVGIGENSTTANATGTIVMPATASLADAIFSSSAHLKKHKAAGHHYYAMLEWSTAANTTTWYGDHGAPTVRQSGISAVYRN